jgi:hypothetical protein
MEYDDVEEKEMKSRPLSDATHIFSELSQASE